MDWRAVDKLIPWVIVILVAAVLYDGFHLVRAAQLNRVLEKMESGDAVDMDGAAPEHPVLHYARAWRLQQDGEFEPALEAYAAIDVRADHPLRSGVQYNLANLYLRRALQYRADGADDLALPLMELAKEYYREVLRTDSGDWRAKYNLELALLVAPETELEPPQEERNPEHNPRSAAGIQVRKPLP
jgi:mxaK protein